MSGFLELDECLPKILEETLGDSWSIIFYLPSTLPDLQSSVTKHLRHKMKVGNGI